MLGKAVGARDERDRIVLIIEDWQADIGEYKDLDLTQLIRLAIRKHNDWARHWNSHWVTPSQLCGNDSDTRLYWAKNERTTKKDGLMELLGWSMIILGAAVALFFLAIVFGEDE